MNPALPEPTTLPTTPSQFTKGVEPFKDWLCPISLTLMTTPMVAADGYTYEKTAIEQWLQTHTTSPMDRSPILDRRLYKNTALMVVIQAWKSLNPEVVRKDQELDRQLELTTLRTKPAPVALLLPSAHHLDSNPFGSRIEAVFDQFLDNRCWIFNNLACSDLINNRFRKAEYFLIHDQNIS